MFIFAHSTTCSYLWPIGHPGLQLRIVICIVILVTIRVVNVLVPLWYKKIVDSLETQHNVVGGSIAWALGNDINNYNSSNANFTATPPSEARFGADSDVAPMAFPWEHILVYVCLRYMQVTSPFVYNLRVAPWLTPAAAATVAASAASNTRSGLTERDVVQAIGEEELVERLTVDVV